jgi:XTP/dITP diphosphohydrolase
MGVMELLLATQNAGKLNEMRVLLAGMPFQIVTPRDLGIFDSPEETGTTFQENATLKARHYAQLTGRLAVADDSGLSVDALGGAPGLYSSRFGGEGRSDADRNALLLEKLRGVPDAQRTARFTCAVVVALGEELLFQAVEHVEGLIAHAPSGPNGFGYDPLFYYPPFGETFGTAPAARKDTVSHRGKAFARLRLFLEAWLREQAGAKA